MSNKRRESLPHLKIVQNLNMQQPTGGPGQALYSPALPTSIAHSFHPSFPVNNPLQTPMQPFFTNPPGAPGRPGHHAHHASIQLAAAGIHPPDFMTPVATHFPRPSMMLPSGTPPQPPSHPFPNRNRRQLSIGGPPKAVLGGPTRKLSPLPGATGPSISPAATPAPPPAKPKKIIINLPKETVIGEDGEPSTRPSWARDPLPKDSIKDASIEAVEITTAETYPPDAARLGIPAVVDVYLPGKLAWGALKHKTIEEKLEKLGVQPGSGNIVPQIHAPHARAASISSPADPALLLFKLNKLQLSQQMGGSSAGNSLSTSPQPPNAVAPFGLSPSPRSSRLITNRHGHTMSLAQPPTYSYQSSLFSASPSPFNPFGSNAVLGSESVAESQISESSGDGIYAPQGRVPMTIPSFAAPLPPLSAVGGRSHIDFIRGFGLDAPQESEEESEEAQAEPIEESEQEEEDEYIRNPVQGMEGGNSSEGEEAVEYDDGRTTVPASRLHSRHVSKLSAALSLRSVGGNFTAQFQEASEERETEEEANNGEEADDEDDGPDKENEPPHEIPRLQQLQQLDDPAEEWTGSEDLYLGLDTSDDESIGEWSNPSDEERARQQRVERRMRRRAAQVQHSDQPRRLPNFPRPPENPLGFIPRRDGDIISNPSEENLLLARQAEFVGVTTEEYVPEPTHAPSLSQGMPLHSRVTSAQHSYYDPAMAHSRQPSNGSGFPEPSFHQSTLSIGTGRRESLNPFAKPFVFGARRESGSWQHVGDQSQSPSIQTPVTSLPTHSRLPSIGKPLNVAAAEFKPGGFSFRLPGAPTMPAPEPSIPLPLPQPAHQPLETIPSVESTPFKVQGREKRQRRASSSSMEEGDSFASFKFPMKLETSSPPSIRRHRSRSSLSAPTKRDLDPDAEPFTFAGFNAVASNMPRLTNASQEEQATVDEDETPDDSGTAHAENSAVRDDELGQEIVVPVIPKQKRTPLPLDFKHPVSSNTVPAGLFKALVNNEDRTRRSVRSRLSSREIFEHMHRPSMDDDDVAMIAHKNPRGRLVSDSGRPSPAATDDVFGSIRHARRRSSLPDAFPDDKNSSPSEPSVAPRDLSTRMEFHHIEDVLSQMLDEKFADLRHHISRKEQPVGTGVNQSSLNDVIALIRSQLQESTTRSLENSQLDAKGELDYQLIKDILDDNQQQIIAELQRELRQHAVSGPSSNASLELMPGIDQVGKRTVSAVVEAISELSARQEAMASNASAREHDLIVDKLVNVLSPMLHSLHNEPIDYDFLTSQLTQAVKPHISQLIDLASDKRETAGLILDKILPHLPLPSDFTIDTDAITIKLISEVRRAIAPIDAFEIKEQVADLVVERLDSRLAVRDKAFNVDIVTSRVTESVSQLLETLNTVPAALDKLAVSQKEAEEKQASLSNSQSQTIVSSLTELPVRLGSQLDDLKSLQQDILKKVDQPPAPAPEPDANVLLVKNAVETLVFDQKKLAEQNEANLSHNKVLLDKLDALPREFKVIVNGLQGSFTELFASNDSSKRELEDLRKINTEAQIQVTKARGSYGQVRVEKDVLGEKLAIVEADRDRLRTQAQEHQARAASKVKEMGVLEVRNAELEEALAKALARLQSADVVAETNQRNMADLEKANTELTAEKQELKAKIESLELNTQFVSRERDSTFKALEALQAQHTQLISHQTNWDVLNAATEKINMVFHLLENADSEEQKELRHYRDRSKALDDENAILQKRIKDIEAKLANSDRTSATARQSLTQAQQRSSEWERRAKESEGQVEILQTTVDQAEQTQNQLEADYQMAKMQLEENEADGRLQQDRSNKLREQVSALEAKCSLLQKELEKALAAAKNSVVRSQINGAGTHTPSRPDSRASTVYGDGSSTHRVPTYSTPGSRSVSSSRQSFNEPAQSVYDSMHAPRNTVNGQNKWNTSTSMHTPSPRYSTLAPPTPKARHLSYNNPYPRAPSPTPSTVSAAPTQGDDGWWT